MIVPTMRMTRISLMGVTIELHSVDDYEALYVDGKLAYEGHSGTLG